MGRLVVLFISFLLACVGNGVDPEIPPTASGNWVALVSDTTTIRLSLTEAADGSLSGTGSVSIGETESTSLTVPTGDHDHPFITIEIAQPPAPATRWMGEFSGADQFWVTETRTEGQTLVFNRS